MSQAETFGLLRNPDYVTKKIIRKMIASPVWPHYYSERGDLVWFEKELISGKSRFWRLILRECDPDIILEVDNFQELIDDESVLEEYMIELNKKLEEK